MGRAAKIVTRTGCMWRLFAPPHVDALGAGAQVLDGRLHIYINANATLESVEAAVARAARVTGVSRTMTRLMMALPALLFGLIAMLLIALTGIFNDQLKNFLGAGLVPSEAALRWGVISLAIGALLIGYAPHLIAPPQSEQENSFIRALKEWLNPGRRSVSRLNRTLRALAGRRGFAVTIWNPIVPRGDWVRSALIAPCAAHGIDLELIVHADEVDNVIGHLLSPSAKDISLRANARKALESAAAEMTLDDPACSAASAASPSRQALAHVLEPNEMTLLSLLLACSTSRFTAAWRDGLSRSRLAQRHVVATSLAEHLLSRYRVHFSGDGAAVPIPLQTFLQRCQRDYLLLERTVGARDFAIRHNALWPDEMREDDRADVAERLLIEDQRLIMDNVADPTALFVMLGKQTERDPGSTAQNTLITRFASLALRYEAFGYAAVVCDVLLDPPEADAADGAAWTERFYGLPTDALRNWASLMQSAGKFATALKLVTKLKAVARLDYAVDEARLLERLGRAPEGIVALDREYAPFKDFPGAGYAQRVDPHDHSDRYLKLALRYHLQCAWIIVSGRLEDRRAQARQALDQAREMLTSPWLTNVESDDRWRYFNYEANYAEWVGDLPGARDMHVEALKVPGTSLKWISGSEVNLGIVYRRLFETSGDPADIARALQHGQRACDIKEAMGDHDELAVALHNFAWSKLLSASGAASDDPRPELNSIIEITERALAVLDATRADKKRPQLYAERFSAHYLLLRLGAGDRDAARIAYQAFHDFVNGRAPDADIADGRALLERFTANAPQAEIETLLGKPAEQEPPQARKTRKLF